MSKKRDRSKRANRLNPRLDRHHQENSNIVQFTDYQRPSRKRIDLVPRNMAQEEYIESLLDENKSIVVATGPAGCGKTMLATLAALKALNEGTCNKIVITRPNIAVDNHDVGFLPGDILKKMLPWMLPIIDVVKEHYSIKEVQRMLEDEVIEVCPIAYIRGRTFKNSWVIVDEAQGTTKNSMLSILTRIGENSKMIITGDLKQSDIGYNNGLSDFLDRFKEYANSDYIDIINFGVSDVERSPVVAEILKIYNES